MAWTRREFLSAGSFAGLGAWGTSAPRAGLLLRLTGGPSQLDTWDPKPAAPSTVRSVYRAIPANVAGIQVTELFPRMARCAERYALVRSVFQEAPATHEAGWKPWQPLLPGEPEAAVVRGGADDFGERCREAVRRIESGASLVTVDMFGSVYREVTWDAHGFAPFSSLASYREGVAEQFDAAYTALLEDLDRRGLLSRTLVVATGEFGRTPWLNAAGGRDHWPGCWTALLAGGGVQGGQVLGASDAIAAEPRERPVPLAEVVAMMRDFLAGGAPGEGPLRELFA